MATQTVLAQVLEQTLNPAHAKQGTPVLICLAAPTNPSHSRIDAEDRGTIPARLPTQPAESHCLVRRLAPRPPGCCSLLQELCP